MSNAKKVGAVKSKSISKDGLTEEQTTILKQFRQRLKDVLKPRNDDYDLLRWLRARKFNLDKAEAMFRENLKFRQNMSLDDIPADYKFPEVYEKYYSFAHIGFDKEGNIVIVDLAGYTDMKGFARSLSYPEHVKLFSTRFEILMARQREYNKKNKTNGRQLIYIVDEENVDALTLMDPAVLKLCLDNNKVVEANFPELLKKCYALNVSPYFYTWFNMIKGFIDPATVEKLCFRRKTDNWQADLLEIIDADVLPAFLGGTRTDPDGNPECRTLFVREPKIPTSYYVSTGEFKAEPNMTELSIRKRSFYNHLIEVKEVNSRISWVFQTEGYNIKFGLFFAKKGSDVKSAGKQQELKKEKKTDNYDILIKVQLVESHRIPERGGWICEKEGTYILHFDNTFSVLTPKHLSFKAKVLPPSAALQL